MQEVRLAVKKDRGDECGVGPRKETEGAPLLPCFLQGPWPGVRG